MIRVCRWLVFAMTLLCGERTLLGAGAEDSAFTNAATTFRAGFYPQAADDFASFEKKFPHSPRVPEAVLYEARARFCLGQFAGAIELLSTNRARAGALTNEYLYWIGQTHFENRNYPAAADAFGQLVRDSSEPAERLDAIVREALARSRLADWPAVVALLQPADGVFQEAVHSGLAHDVVARGHLLLGEAHLALGDFNAVEASLASLAALRLDAESAWRRQFLQSRLQRTQGRVPEALLSATNLLASANLTNRAEGVSFLAETWEQLGQLDEARGAQQMNLTNAPAPYRRRALMKIAELSFAQNQTALAADIIQRFLTQFPKDPATDAALLALGELDLKQFVLGPGTNAPNAGATNLCDRALSRLDTLLTNYPNSALRGKALLYKGWCFWAEEQYAASRQAFQEATEQLTRLEDQAVARFKWADAQFQLGDFAGALTNYNFMVNYYASVPEVKDRLLEQALYQAVRSALNLTNLTAATNALQKILEWYPDGFAGDHCLLLAGRGFAQQGDTAGARAIFAEIESRHAAPEMVPEVRLAVVRTYERETNWDAAITDLLAWITAFTNRADLPDAEFSLAWDYSMAGQESTAFMRFTNFVARYPTNLLAQQAQFWIGEHYFNLGDPVSLVKSDASYQWVFKNTNWPPSRIAYEAQMMAGRAAVAGLSYDQAIQYYFKDLAGNTNCPPDLRAEAYFAWADALVARGSTNESARVANLNEAIALFQTDALRRSELAMPALGRVGDCYKLMAAANPQYYASASNAYQEVLSSTNASLNTQYQAKIGLGLVAEKLGAAEPPEKQTALLNEALRYYLQVFFDDESFRNHGESEVFWVQKAGLEAARLAGELKLWKQQIDILERLRQLLPVLRQRQDLDDKIQKARARLGL